ncbi:carboxylate-amine ligase [Mycobacteroides abscessus subsp. abscessus]|nr:carboxylate-amine ligase [Mycobacteroides abscessus subsp. abscessus]
MARAELARIVEQGNGAMRQRRAWCTSGNVKDVISEIAIATIDFN